ncbi:MAG: GNAT family N-acetyltransferase [Sphingomonadaceae bacterium]|nr:GNAT family N-acetyltransferase [Sphingomonadaceae bacterium]
MSTAPSPALTLRDGGQADLGEVMTSMIEAFAPEFGEAWTAAQCGGILPLPGVRLILAKLGTTPAGFALARVIAGEAELLLLGVRPRFRRGGIGGALLVATVAYAREAGADHIHLEMRDGNPALSLYRTAGFVQIGRRPRYYRGTDGRLIDALTLSLRLVGAHG